MSRRGSAIAVAARADQSIQGATTSAAPPILRRAHAVRPRINRANGTAMPSASPMVRVWYTTAKAIKNAPNRRHEGRTSRREPVQRAATSATRKSGSERGTRASLHKSGSNQNRTPEATAARHEKFSDRRYATNSPPLTATKNTLKKEASAPCPTASGAKVHSKARKSG